MIKGLYSAFNGMASAWRYQDMLANNVANSSTVGFKREVAATQSFADVLLSQQTPVPAPIAARIQGIVGQIGTGSFVADFQTDFTQGEFQMTGQPLDFALDEGFFAVQAADGTIRYTRDGRFTRDTNGNLLNNAGDSVLDVNGAPIILGGGVVNVDRSGTVLVDGVEVARLQGLDFAPGELARDGAAYFTSTATGTPVEGGVRQGFLEQANTNLIEDMTSMLAVQRTYQANQAVLAKLDGTLEAAAGQIGTFGR